MEGLKWPIGAQKFPRLREEGYLYIDKTPLIYDLLQGGNSYFLSRPRRMGKSLFDRLVAYWKIRDKSSYSLQML